MTIPARVSIRQNPDTTKAIIARTVLKPVTLIKQQTDSLLQTLAGGLGRFTGYSDLNGF
jgi:hypothetical protein